MNWTELPVSLYLHIPFCTTKCTYCAFNTYINLESLIKPFVEALATEIRIVARSVDNPTRRVGTIFFGGGTPTLLTLPQFAHLLETIHDVFEVVEGAEITTEANPNDLDAVYLAGLRQLGINRISIGMQSANPTELKLFARRHDHEKVTEVMPQARRAGFDNVNLDLMYGTPYQTLETWRETLNETLKLSPEHVSLYALGLEDGTPLKEWVEAGRVPTPDDDLAADMYDLATQMLDGAGYHQYEISNWSKTGRECAHNLQYWRNLPYVGLGPGAHGYAGGVRYATMLSPMHYIKQMRERAHESFVYPRTPATVDEVQVTHEDEIAETLIMGLRLTTRGIVRREFAERFGVDLTDYHRKTIQQFTARGLLEVDEERVRLTAEGRLLSNLVFRELV